MAEGRTSALWDHTSQIIALLCNIHRDPKRSSKVTPDEVHPIKRRVVKPESVKVSTEQLRAAFSALPTRTIPASMVKVKGG